MTVYYFSLITEQNMNTSYGSENYNFKLKKLRIINFI